MTVSIHQPNFIPWIGYFFKIYKSDTFVILDNVQFTKNSLINRNQIKTPQGAAWLTLPVEQSGKFGQTIKECVIHNKELTVKKTISTLQSNYTRAPYFKDYIKQFTDILDQTNNNLCELNIAIIKWLIKELELNTKIILSSELDSVEGESTERLVSICTKLEASHYLAGLGAKKYQDDQLFKENEIEVISTPFKYPTYHQQWGEFTPNLTILDVLFNCGPKTKSILQNSI